MLLGPGLDEAERHLVTAGEATVIVTFGALRTALVTIGFGIGASVTCDLRMRAMIERPYFSPTPLAAMQLFTNGDSAHTHISDNRSCSAYNSASSRRKRRTEPTCSRG